jgi:hypothetical protein
MMSKINNFLEPAGRILEDDVDDFLEKLPSSCSRYENLSLGAKQPKEPQVNASATARLEYIKTVARQARDQANAIANALGDSSDVFDWDAATCKAKNLDEARQAAREAAEDVRDILDSVSTAANDLSSNYTVAQVGLVVGMTTAATAGIVKLMLTAAQTMDTEVPLAQYELKQYFNHINDIVSDLKCNTDGWCKTNHVSEVNTLRTSLRKMITDTKTRCENKKVSRDDWSAFRVEVSLTDHVNWGSNGGARVKIIRFLPGTQQFQWTFATTEKSTNIVNRYQIQVQEALTALGSDCTFKN